MFRKALLAVALLFAAAPAFAQIAVQQNATRADAATFWVGTAQAGATTCTTVSTTAANDTLTITPPAGQYVYVTQLLLQVSTDATGATQTGYITPAGFNFAGTAPVISEATALTTVQGFAPPNVINFNPPLKSALPGQAVSFTPSATQNAHVYLCMSATGYFAN